MGYGGVPRTATADTARGHAPPHAPPRTRATPTRHGRPRPTAPSVSRVSGRVRRGPCASSAAARRVTVYVTRLRSLQQANGRGNSEVGRRHGHATCVRPMRMCVSPSYHAHTRSPSPSLRLFATEGIVP